MRGKGSEPTEKMNGETPDPSAGSVVQQRLESIFRAAPVGIGLVRSRIILEANDKLCEMTGYSRDELTGKSALMLYPSREEFDRVGREKYAQIQRTGTGTVETVWKHKDGSLMDVLLSSSVIERGHPEKGLTFSALDITWQKKTMTELHEMDGRFRRMLSVVPDMISVHSPDFDILYSNWRGFAEVPEHLRKPGTKCYSTYRGLDDICPDCRARAILESGTPFRTIALLPEGGWYDIRVIPIIDDDGKVEAFMEWVRDITSEKQAKNAEEANAALLRIAGETAGFGGWRVDLKRDKCTWSDAVCDMHGMPRGYSPGSEEAIAFYAPEWRERIQQVFKACAIDGIPYSEEMEIITGSGERVWVRTIGRPVTDSAGNIVEVQGSFQDITDQKKAEKRLRRNTERMDFLLRATNTNINIMDSDHALTFVDERWKAVYGDYRGKKCYSYFMGREEPCEGCGIPEALRTGETVVTEEYLPREDRFVEVHTIPFQGGDGSWQLAEFNVDITKRKRAEEDREKLRFQLMQMMKMESVGRLAGGVAHDFNNMLGVILGNAEIALQHLDPSMPLYDELKEIQSAARRSADLTGQLLTFARRQTIAPRLINMNEKVESMLQMLGRLVGENITLNWNPGKDLQPVRLDPTQFDQLLANLVVNARDAIDGLGSITIETASTAEERIPSITGAGPAGGIYTCMAVSDDGCGMDDETRQHIFEPFYTTKETGRGTGLGLSTVYGIVKQNDGFVQVRSAPGRGTTIRVFLPAGNGSDAAEENSPGEAAAPRGTGTILLVEDEESVLKMTRTMLQNLGYDVLAASTPAEAMELAEHHRDSIDLLLTDVVMPQMNGKDLAIKLTGENPDLKCLFMSGYAADVMGKESSLPEADRPFFIRKPFTVSELAKAVRKTIGD